MLFMGEEWGAATPWQFFTSHPEPELGGPPPTALREFAEHGWDADVVPDPQDPETFTRSKLDWAELGGGSTTGCCEVPTAPAGPPAAATRPDGPVGSSTCSSTDDADERWIVLRRGSLAIACNLGTDAVAVPVTGEIRAGVG